MIQKQTQKSLERFRAGLEIFQRRGQKLGLAWSWRNLGLAQLLDGQLAEAAKSFQGGLALYEEFGSVDGMAAVLEGIAGVMILRGHHQPGGRLLGVAAAARDRLGMPVSPNLQAIYDRIFLMSSFNPDDEPWAAELAYGRTIPFDQAMEELWPLLPLTDQPESSSNTPVT
jgi:hypothetical protein